MASARPPVPGSTDASIESRARGETEDPLSTDDIWDEGALSDADTLRFLGVKSRSTLRKIRLQGLIVSARVAGRRVNSVRSLKHYLARNQD